MLGIGNSDEIEGRAVDEVLHAGLRLDHGGSQGALTQINYLGRTWFMKAQNVIAALGCGPPDASRREAMSGQEGDMNKRIPPAILGLLFACMSGVVHAQKPAAEGSTGEGRAFALEFCTACHVVAANQPYPPIYKGPSPSFISIANRPTTTVDGLRRFIRTTHPTITKPLNMPSVEVTDYQLDQIIGYILSLRGKR